MDVFLVPKIGAGTRHDPYRPKHILNERLAPLMAYRSIDAGDHFLVEFHGSTGSEPLLSQLEQKPDVQRIPDSDTPISAADESKVRTRFTGKLAIARKNTGREVIEELKAAVKVKQILNGLSETERSDLIDRATAQLALEGRRGL